MSKRTDDAAGELVHYHPKYRGCPKPIDIAMGLLAYRQLLEQLRDWAAFVLGASELVDPGPLDEWPEGDQLLNGLWDASFEGEIKPETFGVATALAEG